MKRQACRTGIVCCSFALYQIKGFSLCTISYPMLLRQDFISPYIQL